MMKKVLLVNPHETEQSGYTNPPLGLLYLAGTLLRHGGEVRLVDACVKGREAVAAALEEFRPDIVAITALTPGRHKALDLARLAKAILPDALVVLGGAHPTIMFKQILGHYPEVDVAVLGEGELTLLELAEGRDVSEVRGLAYRREGKVQRTPHRQNAADLDALAPPAWQLVDFADYQPRGAGIYRGIDLAREPRVSVIYSRGCTGHCDFCSTWWIWKGWRHRSAANMVDELETLTRRRGVRHFCFADDALTIDRQATLDLCAEIRRRDLNIAFHATTRTDCVDEEVLAALAAAGCYQISYGVESGSQRLLQQMGKENETAQAERALRLTREAGMAATALMIIGNVGETEETLRETIEFLQRADPTDVGCVGGLWILPGTKLYRQCVEQRLIDDDFWLGPKPYEIYTREWSAAALAQMQHLVTNFRRVQIGGAPPRPPRAPAPAPTRSLATDATQAAIPLPSLLEKWQRYVRVEANEYSARTEWTDAQAQHVELMAKLPAGCRDVLDLGCGDGWTTDRLRQLGKRAVGVTVTPAEAEHARTRYGLRQVVCDMHDLQLPDGSFDAIYARESFEHAVAPFIALCEMNRVLRPGGHALLNVPWDDWIREDSHYSVLSPAQMREMFYKCRFVVEAEGRTALGHFWYLARKVAEIGQRHPSPPPVPGKPWIEGRVLEGPAPADSPRAASSVAAPPPAPTPVTPSARAASVPPRVLCMMRVKNEEAWIGQALDKASAAVDGFVILDDGSTDRTGEICRAHPKVLRCEFQREAVTDEARDKDRLLQSALDFDPDWILALDGDELLEDAGPAILRRAVASSPPEVTSFSMRFLYMWDAHDRHRVDGKYRRLVHPRLFRTRGIGIPARSLRFKTTEHGANFHCGSVPGNMPGQVRELDLMVKHYGYFEREQRGRKRRFYEAKDPGAAKAGYYDHLTDETGIRLEPWAERPLLAREAPTSAPTRRPVLRINASAIDASARSLRAGDDPSARRTAPTAKP